MKFKKALSNQLSIDSIFSIKREHAHQKCCLLFFKKIIKKTDLDSATLTGVLDRLEAGGFIERRQNPDDRRSIRIHLTERGRTTGEKVVKFMEEANSEFLRRFNASEEVALRSLLTRIRQ